MSPEFEYTKNGKPYILYLNNKYRESYTVKNGEIIWRCLGSKCRASVKTDANRVTILSANNNHSGPHPVTMRTLTSQQRCSPSVAPAAKSDTPRSAAPSPSTSTPRCATPPDILATPTPPCILEEENQKLRSELDSLKEERQIILNHTIESDFRLLQYTDNIFTTNTSVSESSQYSKCDHAVQCELLFPLPSEDCIRENRNLQETLDKYRLEIKELELTIHSYREVIVKYGILQDETKNMIESIRSLEEDNKQLKYSFESNKNKFLTTLRRKDQELTANQNKIKILEKENYQLKNKIKIVTNQDNMNSHCNNHRTQVDGLLSSPNSYGPLEHMMDDDVSGFTTIRNHRRKNNESGRNNNESRGNNNNNKNNKKDKNHKTSINFNTPRVDELTKATFLPFKNVTLVGDSHARNLASLMINKTHGSTHISGECKPGAGLLSIAPTTAPPPNNCYVLIAGTNDVAAGRDDVIFSQLRSVIDRCCKTSRVLLVPLPPRYDLPPNSPVHDITYRTNHYMVQLSGRYKDVETLDISRIERRHFTHHGLHLRLQGKKLLTALIVQKLSQMGPVSTHYTEEPTSTAESSMCPITLPYESYSAAVTQTLTNKSSTLQHNTSINLPTVATNVDAPPKTFISGGNTVIDHECNFVSNPKNKNVQPVLEIR